MFRTLNRLRPLVPLTQPRRYTSTTPPSEEGLLFFKYASSAFLTGFTGTAFYIAQDGGVKNGGDAFFTIGAATVVGITAIPGIPLAIIATPAILLGKLFQ